MLSDSSDLTRDGNAFQALAVATGKARSPSVERLVSGTSRMTVSLDRDLSEGSGSQKLDIYKNLVSFNMLHQLVLRYENLHITFYTTPQIHDWASISIKGLDLTKTTRLPH